MFTLDTLNALRTTIRRGKIPSTDLVARTATLLSWDRADLLLELGSGAERAAAAAGVYARIAHDLQADRRLDAYAVAAQCAFHADDYALTRTLIDKAQRHAAALHAEVPAMIDMLKLDCGVGRNPQTPRT